MSSKISTKYRRRESDIATMSERVVEKTDNNPDFTNPPEALAELKKSGPEFRTARVNAQSRDKEMVSIKNDKKALVLSLLQELADYVTATCKGDRTKLLSSGFDVTSDTRSTNSQPPFIEILEVDLGLPGEATTRTRNVTRAKAYIHQYSTEPPGANTVWTGEGSSQGSHTFTGLSSDKRYWFRVIVIGNNRQKAYSPVVSRVIQ